MPKRYGFLTYFAIAASLFGLTVAVFLLKIELRDHHFNYILDDTYIHMALASQIARGTYGINLGEAASPSSSPLWPFLLAPFVNLRFGYLAPFLFNILFSVLTCGIIGRAVASWPYRNDLKLETPRRIASTVALVFIANLITLTFLGMEHSLQVMLAAAVAWGILECLQGRTPPGWVIAAAILAPSVRYECFDLTLALALALIGLREYKRAALTSLSVVPIVAFGLFLKHIGLPFLPYSVLVKGGTIKIHPNYIAGFGRVKAFLLALERTPVMWLLGLLFLGLLAVALTEKARERKFAFAGAAIAVALHFFVGTFGAFSRYESYIVFFAVMVLLFREHEKERGSLGWYSVGLFACASGFLSSTLIVVQASHETFLAQNRVSRFLNDYVRGNSAIEDLGMTAFDRHDPHQYVLDIAMLGSPEIARLPKASPEIYDGLMHEHHIDVVAIYIPFPVSPNWQQLGTACITGWIVATQSRCQTFFAVNAADAPRLRTLFAAWAKTLPEEIEVDQTSTPPDKSKQQSVY